MESIATTGRFGKSPFHELPHVSSLRGVLVVYSPTMTTRKPRPVLGINAIYHESSAALVIGDYIVAAAEEERFSRVKHAKKAAIEHTLELPFRAIEWCLHRAGLAMDDVAGVGYSFSPRLRLDHNADLAEAATLLPGAWGTSDGERRVHELCRLVRRILERWFAVDLTGRFHYLPHHDCHLASAFYPSPFREAAVISVDGIGEWTTTAIAHGTPSGLATLATQVYPNSIGFLWEKLTDFLGFHRNHDECKVMGLASYGDPTVYRPAFDELVTVDDDGFTMHADRLRFRREDDHTALEPLFGPRRLPGEPLAYEGDDRRHADVAAALQALTEDLFRHLGRRAAAASGSRHCCLAGGVALNCVANGVLVREGLFDDLFVQPAAHDAGTALGAAFLLSRRDGPSPAAATRCPRSHAYLGPAFDDDECRAALERWRLDGAVVATAPDDDELLAEVARRLAEGRVVAWFDGALEWGPRALGHRSILADPRNGQMRDILNHRVKHREPFRPFCPSVLAEHAAAWFYLGPPAAPLAAADFMLFAYPTRPDRAAAIPAVVHVDGTSRIQVVHADVTPRYHRLITRFHELTGVPLVLNTSFNDREPIVCTPDDAIRCFRATAIDDLVLGGHLVARERTTHGR